MYNTDLPSAEALVEFFRRFHASASGSFPIAETSAGSSSYELLADIVRCPRDTPVTVVDLGCGDGILTEIILNRYRSKCMVTAVDISPDQLNLAKARAPGSNVKFLCESVQELSIPSLSIDYVLGHMSFMLMRPIERALTEIDRILKPKGVFSIIISGDSEGIDGSYLRICREVLETELADGVSRKLGDKRIYDEKLFSDLVRTHTGFRTPIHIVSFQLLLSFTAAEYLEFVAGDYHWALLSTAGQERIKQFLLNILKPFGEDPFPVPMGMKQLTMTKQ